MNITRWMRADVDMRALVGWAAAKRCASRARRALGGTDTCGNGQVRGVADEHDVALDHLFAQPPGAGAPRTVRQ